jgi:hypothetical protein
MPVKPTTLNRFPLFGLFADRAARRIGYAEDDARLLGYSTALLYAIFKAKANAKKELAEKKEPPKEIEVKTKTLQFGGQDFQVVYSRGKRLKKTVVGHEVHDAAEYDSQIKAKFPAGLYDKLAKAFDKYLASRDPVQIDSGLFELYKAWRDACKVGFNRVDLEKLLAWLGERAR